LGETGANLARGKNNVGKRKMSYSMSAYTLMSLAEVLDIRQTDPFDVLAYIAFGRHPILTRDQRAQAFLQQHADWLKAFPDQQRRVIEALLEQYRLSGVDEMVNPRVFRLPAFKPLGGLKGVSQQFGGGEALRQTVMELQRRLYSFG
jgi:hypothetical protein